MNAFYVKLQDAYISEAVAVGNWVIIGYSGPGTADADKLGSSATNFTYSDDGSYNGTTNTAALGATVPPKLNLENFNKANKGFRQVGWLAQ